jgi:hypothetical protein
MDRRKNAKGMVFLSMHDIMERIFSPTIFIKNEGNDINDVFTNLGQSGRIKLYCITITKIGNELPARVKKGINKAIVSFIQQNAEYKNRYHIKHKTSIGESFLYIFFNKKCSILRLRKHFSLLSILYFSKFSRGPPNVVLNKLHLSKELIWSITFKKRRF